VAEASEVSPDVWSATALDLRLHSQLTFWAIPKGKRLQFRPGERAYNYQEMVDKYLESIVMPDAGHVMRPGDFVLGWTIEKLQLPYRSRIAARVEGKSSLA
jgi:dCTP deaminase